MPIAAPAEPPAKTPRSSSAKKSTPAAQSRLTQRTEALEGYMGLASLGCMAKGWFADSRAITAHATPICTEIAKLGEENESLGNTLDLICKTGPYMGLVMAITPLVLQILANHGKMPVEAGIQLGVVPPAALEAQAKQEIAQIAAAAKKAQREAEKALADAQKEMSQNGRTPEHAQI